MKRAFVIMLRLLAVAVIGGALGLALFAAVLS